MERIGIFDLLAHVQPVAWLALLLAVHYCGARRTTRLERGGIRPAKPDEKPPSYRALGIFAGIQLCSSLLYPVFIDRAIPLALSAHLGAESYLALHWTAYLLSVVCVFFIIGDVVRNSLGPLPGLAAAAIVVFRWTAVLALLLAFTAHLPLFGVHNLHVWLDEVHVSVALCVFSFEITTLVLLLARLSRLGMCLRSRSVGLAFGIALLGLVDLVSAVAPHLAGTPSAWTAGLAGLVTLFVLAAWTLYVVLPEPKRHAHSLSPASKLMRWNEIALKLELSGRQTEPPPFISGVQLIVDGILDKYRIGGEN